MAQLLLMRAWVIRDIQILVAFLTTCVKKLDDDNWAKIKFVLKYLKGSWRLKLNLSIGNISIIKWWMDALYAVNKDCKAYVGDMI